MLGGLPPYVGFDEMYEGTPLWDINHAQPEVVRLADTTPLGPSVLDVGCGTGENALMLGRRGLSVMGIDSSPRAIAKARAKAATEDLNVRFDVADALKLEDWVTSFDAVVDSGLFHVFDDDDRTQYVRGLAAVTSPGASCHVLCFSDTEPDGWGPRRVSEHELHTAFADGWQIDTLRPARFSTRRQEGAARAWLLSARRTPNTPA